MNLVKFTIVFGLALILIGGGVAFGENLLQPINPVEGGWYESHPDEVAKELARRKEDVNVPTSTKTAPKAEPFTGSVPMSTIPVGANTVSVGSSVNYDARVSTPVGQTQPHGAPARVNANAILAPQPQVVYVNSPADRVATTRSSNLNTFVEGSGFANGNSPDANRTGLELVQLNNEAVREDHNHIENMTEIAVRHEENRMENSGRNLATAFNFIDHQKIMKNEEKRREAYQKEERREQNRRTLNDISDELQEWSILRNRQK
jgi:hypothetical protein